MSLKVKAVKGFSWHLLDKVVRIIFQFIVGIILARLISPNDFGIIGITTVFLTLLPIFVDGGFGTALIQKKECSQEEYSSVFYFPRQ